MLYVAKTAKYVYLLRKKMIQQFIIVVTCYKSKSFIRIKMYLINENPVYHLGISHSISTKRTRAKTKVAYSRQSRFLKYSPSIQSHFDQPAPGGGWGWGTG